MRRRKLSLLFLCAALLAADTGASACAAQQRRAGKPAPTPAPTTAPAQPAPAPTGDKPLPNDGQLTELAAGNYDGIADPFVFVARDADTYAALRQLVARLPDERADFFQSHAVVAAFLGQRRSGGYGVEIKQTGPRLLSIGERTPPKGAMVTMALTAPFRVVAVAVEPDHALALELGATWQQRARPYRVTAGELTVYGGFAGMRENAKLAGTLGVMRAGALVTVTFDVESTGGRRARRMTDTASGTVADGGRVTLARLDSFALSGAIESPFRAQGTFADDEQVLTLNFQTVPSPRISDNYEARGQLTANATAPAPPKSGMSKEPM
ncbi:MAG TPA: protease complex subunit PrcB family protein [Pyrinomonadaceae bacterium]|jgi:hypothetical protein